MDPGKVLFWSGLTPPTLHLHYVGLNSEGIHTLHPILTFETLVVSTCIYHRERGRGGEGRHNFDKIICYLVQIVHEHLTHLVDWHGSVYGTGDVAFTDEVR